MITAQCQVSAGTAGRLVPVVCSVLLFAGIGRS